MTTPATECSWDAMDNGHTDLDAAAVEVALGAEHTVDAYFIQWRFAPTCDTHSNGPSGFSPTPTATNGQTSPIPIPSLDGSDKSHASSTPALQCDFAMPSAEVTSASITTTSPMPMKLTPCSFDPLYAKQLGTYHAQWNYNIPSLQAAVAIAESLLPHIHGDSPTPQLSPHGDRTLTALPLLHQH